MHDLRQNWLRKSANELAARPFWMAQFVSLGSQYVLGLRAKNCRNGDALDEEQVQAAKKEDVLNALSQIATKFRVRVGESLSTVQQHNTPLPEATTSSLGALKAFALGEVQQIRNLEVLA